MSPAEKAPGRLLHRRAVVRRSFWERPSRALPDRSLDPIKALFWSAVINGFVAVPVMAAMMWVGSRRDQMGRFTVGPLTLTLGWAATAIMAAAAMAMLAGLVFLSQKAA